MSQPSYWIDRASGPPVRIVRHDEQPPLDKTTIRQTIALYLEPGSTTPDDTTLRLLRGHVAILITELESAIHSPAPSATVIDLASAPVILQEGRRKLHDAYTPGLATSAHGPRLARCARTLLEHLDKLSETQSP